MFKQTAVALALVLAVGCASSPLTQNTTSGTPAIGGSFATRAQDGPDFVLLSGPTNVREYDYSRSIYDLHVRGTMTSRGFIPAGEVQGKGSLCTEGQDWIDFTTLSVHKAGTGTPTAPYLMGCANANGTFTPSTRTIVTQ